MVWFEILRKNFTIILKESILIEGSLRNNINQSSRYYNKEIIYFLSGVELEEFFVNKYLDYNIEDNWINISVKEKQLICIAIEL